jgi:type I restriction enzyme M protein
VNNFGEKVGFIWSVADLLRGPYRPNQYKDVMLPLTVLRRLDCVLEPTKEEVLDRMKRLEGGKVKNVDPILCRVTGVPFYNTSRYTFDKLKGDPNNIAANLTNYMKGFSTRAREIIDHFGFEEHIARLDRADRLYLVVSRFCQIDLHPDRVSNIEMGYIFEELIRRFNEASNEEAGDHFTPREVIRLIVNLLFMPDSDILTTRGIVKTVYDPACGTGGMLSVAEGYVRELNPDARLEVFGQDYNAQAYAICGSDMMIKGQDIDHIAFGDSFTDDRFARHTFDYMLANPPFGVEWKPEADAVRREHENQGFGGRFGAGLPRINDGSLLFLQHMISKMKPPAEGGTRLGIVFNGSPLFTGAAGSGESEIRRWIIENDWLEAIVALPDQLFYNTGIYTYAWIVTNRKEPGRRGKVQLVDGTGFFKKMRKSLGNKRNEVCDEQRDEITRLYGSFADGDHVRVFDNADFGYWRITVERPLRLNFAVDEERLERVRQDTAFAKLATSRKRKNTKAAQAEIEAGRKLQKDILAALAALVSHGVAKEREAFTALVKAAFRDAGIKVTAGVRKAVIQALGERDETAEICLDSKGNPEPDPELRDYENVPLTDTIDGYMAREVLPHVPDAWVDESKTKVGYEINFSRYFYTYTPPRPVEEIESDLKQIEKEISEMLNAE